MAKMKEYLAASENGLVFANTRTTTTETLPTRQDTSTCLTRSSSIASSSTSFHTFDVLHGTDVVGLLIPYRFIRAGVSIQLVKEPIFLHQRHQVQYDQKEWERMTEHFIWMERYQSPRRGPQQVTNEVYRLIRQHARWHSNTHLL